MFFGTAEQPNPQFRIPTPLSTTPARPSTARAARMPCDCDSETPTAPIPLNAFWLSSIHLDALFQGLECSK